MNPQSSGIQKAFLKRIEKKLGSETLLASVLGEVLNLKRSAVYARINGNKYLSLKEVEILATRFNIIPGFEFGPYSAITFTNPSLDKQPETPNDYLRFLDYEFHQYEKNTSVHMHYSTQEIPLFYYFEDESLWKFKLYSYVRNIWKESRLSHLSFQGFRMELGEEVKSITSSILHKYEKYPSTIILSNNFLDTTINQLRYYSYTKDINLKMDISNICNGIRKMLDQLGNQCKTGMKTMLQAGQSPANVLIYINHILYLTNTILIRSDQNSNVYTAFDSPNFLKTDDDQMVRYASNWMEKLKTKSILISQNSENERERFFKIQNEKIDLLESELMILT